MHGYGLIAALGAVTSIDTQALYRHSVTALGVVYVIALLALLIDSGRPGRRR